MLGLLGLPPILQRLLVARHRITTGVDQEVAGIDAVASTKFERLRIAAHHPHWWMRPLKRLHRKLSAVAESNRQLCHHPTWMIELPKHAATLTWIKDDKAKARCHFTAARRARRG
jgi:hypothetical protein